MRVQRVVHCRDVVGSVENRCCFLNIDVIVQHLLYELFLLLHEMFGSTVGNRCVQGVKASRRGRLLSGY